MTSYSVKQRNPKTSHKPNTIWVLRVVHLLHRKKKIRGVSRIADVVDEAVRWNA
jgi:hypothetical protein